MLSPNGMMIWLGRRGEGKAGERKFLKPGRGADCEASCKQLIYPQIKTGWVYNSLRQPVKNQTTACHCVEFCGIFVCEEAGRQCSLETACLGLKQTYQISIGQWIVNFWRMVGSTSVIPFVEYRGSTTERWLFLWKQMIWIPSIGW